MENTNLTLAELERKKEQLIKSIEFLKLRKMDVALYQKAFEKYVANTLKHRLTYDRLLDHPEYYSKWRNTFFDSQIKLIETGLFVKWPNEKDDKTLAELTQIMDRKRVLTSKPICSLSIDELKEHKKVFNYSNTYVYSPSVYESKLNGICKFTELMHDENNPNKKPTYIDVDYPWPILGYCDSVKAVNGKFQLHLIDPYGECLFPPFDITPEEAELALGRICIVNCAYNHYATEPKLLELQILPFTLTEKLGEYVIDTVIIRRSPKINYQPFAFL